MRILAAVGSFKDVYNSIDSCAMVRKLLESEHEVSCLPVCDGGEYTLDILSSFFGEKARIEKAEHICNPYGEERAAHYLTADGAAYIVSAEILHLAPEEDRFKDPCILTDYGLGQLIADAVGKGFRKIRLCLGGTSTIGYGIGTAQALGAVFFDRSGRRMTAPLCPRNFTEIASVQWPEEEYSSVELSVINDGITRACDLATVNPLKIGNAYRSESRKILEEIRVACDAVYRFTHLAPEDAWSGNGGGVYFGVERIFHPKYYKGADYFCDLFGLEAAMENADLVITGEGRFDNPHLKKIPVVVAERAKAQGKPVTFVCGQLAPEWKQRCRMASPGVWSSEELSKTFGIGRILSCTEYYEANRIPPEEAAKLYGELTPKILKERFQQIGVLS